MGYLKASRFVALYSVIASFRSSAECANSEVVVEATASPSQKCLPDPLHSHIVLETCS
jgi:hypothetical protein